MLYKVISFVFLFFVMGFSYEAFMAQTKYLMVFNIVLAIYFGIGSSMFYQKSLDTHQKAK